MADRPPSAPRAPSRSRPRSIASATAGACSSSRRCSTGPRGSTSSGDAVAGIAPNILTDRLRRLERERIVVVDALPAASAADVLRAHRRRPRPRVGRCGCSPTGAPARGPMRRTDPARPVRHAARDALVLPDLRRSSTPDAGGADPDDRPPTTRSAPRTAGYTRACDGRRALGTRDAGPRPAGRAARRSLPPSLQGLPPRSVPEVAPTPLQRHYVMLSVIVLICGAIAITALELGAPLGSPLVKLCVVSPRRSSCHHGRRDRPDLALGVGLDAGRPDEGRCSAWPGSPSACRARGPASWPARSSSCWPDGRRSSAGRDGRSTDLAVRPRRPGLDRLDPQLLLALRLAAALRRRSRARTASGSPARLRPHRLRQPAARGDDLPDHRRRRDRPDPARDRARHGRVGAARRLPRGRRDRPPGRDPRDAGRRPGCSSSRARSSGSTRGSRRPS